MKFNKVSSAPYNWHISFKIRIFVDFFLQFKILNSSVDEIWGRKYFTN